MSSTISSPTRMLESDLETAARFMYASQLQQATNRFAFLDWPNESAQLALYNKIMREMFQDSNNEMYKITTDSGEMIASLVLTRNMAVKEDQVDSSTGGQQKPAPVHIPGMNPAVRPVMRSSMMGVLEPMREIDHLALSTIFVRPDVRIKGVGTLLVKLCIERAAAEHLPLFLCSVPSAANFYRKLGFKDTKHVDIDLGQWGPKHGGFGIYRLQGMLASKD